MTRFPLAKGLAVSAILVLAGCASTPDVRKLATQTGLTVQTLNNGTTDFLAAQNELNAQNAARLEQLGRGAAALRASVRQQQFAWVDSGDTVRTASYARAIAVPASAITDSLTVRTIDVPKLDAAATGQYAKVTKALAVIATKPKAFDQITELVIYAQEVGKDYGALTDAAKKAASDTTTASATADATTTAAGADAAHPQ